MLRNLNVCNLVKALLIINGNSYRRSLCSHTSLLLLTMHTWGNSLRRVYKPAQWKLAQWPPMPGCLVLRILRFRFGRLDHQMIPGHRTTATSGVKCKRNFKSVGICAVISTLTSDNSLILICFSSHVDKNW